MPSKTERAKAILANPNATLEQLEVFAGSFLEAVSLTSQTRFPEIPGLQRDIATRYLQEGGQDPRTLLMIVRAVNNSAVQSAAWEKFTSNPPEALEGMEHTMLWELAHDERIPLAIREGAESMLKKILILID